MATKPTVAEGVLNVGFERCYVVQTWPVDWQGDWDGGAASANHENWLNLRFAAA